MRISDWSSDVFSSDLQYFADVPYPAEGGNVPTYDLANIQVLRGPQGTLFGRNTMGGVILMNPQAPTRQFEGYAKVTNGRRSEERRVGKEEGRTGRCGWWTYNKKKHKNNQK